MSCGLLEYLGGIFESFDHLLKVRNRLVSNKARIHRLYYDAEAAFDCLEALEAAPTASYQGSKLREKLRSLAAEVAARGIFMCPVITVAEVFVLEFIRSNDIDPKGILDDSCLSYVQIDLAEVKFAPDGKLWRMKGVCAKTENTN